MKKLMLSMLTILAISGCATYTYKGQQYDSNEKFQQAVNTSVSEVLSSISPLSSPLTKKKLVIAFPSEKTWIKLEHDGFVEKSGKQPTAFQTEVMANLTTANYKNIKVFADAVQKKNIYTSTQLIEMQDGNETFAPAVDTDTLYLFVPSPTGAQWYFSSAKNGKQVFAYDRSSSTAIGKVLAFVDAVQAQAIRD